ncbi:MAG: hypothetical protein AVDCRST_MAG93-4368 [uncultured Chloroflexia bacterium]|uniref:Lipoprotein n=1 Tax=uncultured Chloroflexia bacterium TaxID=1672391 RepID=A0A6J4K785_9CHLR|nr:MAG: hypothetical protein AVDCRST_MAG93-4368 [uncultured Chloroflexia bacterium]
MRKSTLSLAVLLACLCLTSCAPVIVGRTPQPAAPGEWKFSLNAGYPSNIGYPPNQVPVAQPVNLFLSRGVGGNTEVNGTLTLPYGGTPLRLGGKTLLVDDMVPVAVDYGVSLPAIVFDAGLLFSYPQPGVEPYGALRGFVTSPTSLPGLWGALTVGADIPVVRGNFFVEVTAHTMTPTPFYDSPQPPIGFSIVPALGYRF